MELGINIVESGRALIQRWDNVTFSPSRLFDHTGFRLDTTSFQFAIGCFLIGYICSILTCIGYFATFFPHNLNEHLSGERLKTTLEAVSMLSGGYVIAMIVLALCLGSMSYLVYRGFGSGQNFEQHFGALLHLRNLEPIAAIAITLFLLQQPDYSYEARQGLLPFKSPTWAVCLLVVFVLTRLYYLRLGWIALCGVHVGVRRRWIPFLIGFVPVEIVGAIVFTLFTLILGSMATHNFD